MNRPVIQRAARQPSERLPDGEEPTSQRIGGILKPTKNARTGMVKTGPISFEHLRIIELGDLKNSTRCPTTGIGTGRGWSVIKGGASFVDPRRGLSRAYQTPKRNAPTIQAAIILLLLL